MFEKQQYLCMTSKDGEVKNPGNNSG